MRGRFAHQSKPEKTRSMLMGGIGSIVISRSQRTEGLLGHGAGALLSLEWTAGQRCAPVSIEERPTVDRGETDSFYLADSGQSTGRGGRCLGGKANCSKEAKQHEAFPRSSFPYRTALSGEGWTEIESGWRLCMSGGGEILRRMVLNSLREKW